MEQHANAFEVWAGKERSGLYRAGLQKRFCREVSLITALDCCADSVPEALASLAEMLRLLSDRAMQQALDAGLQKGDLERGKPLPFQED